MLKQYLELVANHHYGLHGVKYLHVTDHTIKEYREQVESMLVGARAAQRAVSQTPPLYLIIFDAIAPCFVTTQRYSSLK